MRSGLFRAREASIRLYKFESGIPRFVAAPHYLGVGLTASLRMNQPDALVQRQVRPHNGHAAGVADVHGDGVRAFIPSPLLPLDKELHAGNDSPLASEAFP